jgi:hypothetical protein
MDHNFLDIDQNNPEVIIKSFVGHIWESRSPTKTVMKLFTMNEMADH